MSLGSCHIVWWNKHEIICENGMYGLRNHTTKFPSLSAVIIYLTDIENNLQSIMNRTGDHERDCTHDEP